MKKILVVFDPDENLRNTMENILSDYEFIYRDATSANQMNEKDLENIEIILGNTSVDLITRCKDLKWFQLFTAGTDFYPPELLENILVTNATGIYGHAISEYMVGTVFELFKKLHLYRDNQKKRI